MITSIKCKITIIAVMGERFACVPRTGAEIDFILLVFLTKMPLGMYLGD